MTKSTRTLLGALLLIALLVLLWVAIFDSDEASGATPMICPDVRTVQTTEPFQCTTVPETTAVETTAPATTEAPTTVPETTEAPTTVPETDPSEPATSEATGTTISRQAPPEAAPPSNGVTKTLARTGLDSTALGLIALALFGGGAVLVAATRRPQRV
jgi:cytoskeletal protein RodZ